MIPCHLRKDSNSFCTRTFLIRYSDEEIAMNDLAIFELNLNSLNLKNSAVILDAELMFSDMHGQFQGVAYSTIDEIVEFKSVSIRSFKILRPTNGT